MTDKTSSTGHHLLSKTGAVHPGRKKNLKGTYSATCVGTWRTGSVRRERVTKWNSGLTTILTNNGKHKQKQLSKRMTRATVTFTCIERNVQKKTNSPCANMQGKQFLMSANDITHVKPVMGTNKYLLDEQTNRVRSKPDHYVEWTNVFTGIFPGWLNYCTVRHDKQLGGWKILNPCFSFKRANGEVHQLFWSTTLNVKKSLSSHDAPTVIATRQTHLPTVWT